MAKTHHSPKARSLTAVHAAWCIGPRRVAIACAEDSRPAACCIVDALVARGYDAELQTGSDAREALRRDDDPGRLRVLWLPDHGDRSTKDKLRRALDPQGAGDVLVLASPTPRGVIEAIEAFASGKERPRARSGPRRTYLNHPTRCEAKVDVRGFTSATLGAAAATAAVLLAVRFGSEMMTPSPAADTHVQATPAPRPVLPIAPRVVRRPMIDETVLGASALPFDEPVDEVADHVPARVRPRAPARPKADVAAAVDEAPLEDVVTIVPQREVELAPATSPAMIGAPPTIIDPF